MRFETLGVMLLSGIKTIPFGISRNHLLCQHGYVSVDFRIHNGYQF